jgi:2-polyprenyl-6-methoxyphenol hydroxylase-like FAD-dependent oxidoreductase
MRRTGVASHANKLLRQQSLASRATAVTYWQQQQRFNHVRTTAYDVGILGGGITGLTAAYRLSKDPNCIKITIHEKSSTLGGWLQSETIDVDGGQIVFEYGPRTLRAASPASFPLLDLVRNLGSVKKEREKPHGYWVIEY